MTISFPRACRVARTASTLLIASVSGGAGAVAMAQTNPSILVDQIPATISSPARIRVAAPRPLGAAADALQPAQMPQGGQSRSAPPQLSGRTTETRVAAVPSHLADACDKARTTRTDPPKGIDCKAVLHARADAPPPRRATPEEVLLGVAPAESALVANQQRTNLPDANDVARRLGSGDVQGAPIAEAVGAIVQQRAQSTSPK